jgi:tellurite resistance protein
MLFQLRDLSENEKDAVLSAPIYVGLLVGGADGELSKPELDRLVHLIEVKTFSEGNDVQNIYEAIEEFSNDNVSSYVQKKIGQLPSDLADRETELVNRLARLNSILAKLSKTYARQYYKSLKDIAVSVANADGGFFGISAISHEEKEFISLPMIDAPA